MVWHVQREESAGEDLVLVAADYEYLTDEEALELAEAIRDVAHRRAYYIYEGGRRYATRAEYEAQP